MRSMALPRRRMIAPFDTDRDGWEEDIFIIQSESLSFIRYICNVYHRPDFSIISDMAESLVPLNYDKGSGESVMSRLRCMQQRYPELDLKSLLPKAIDALEKATGTKF